jgi:hypothetical protein
MTTTTPQQINEFAVNLTFNFSFLIFHLAYTYSTKLHHLILHTFSSPFNHTLLHYFNFLFCHIFINYILFQIFDFYNKSKQMITGPTIFIQNGLTWLLIVLHPLQQIIFCLILGNQGIASYYFLALGLFNTFITYTYIRVSTPFLLK